MVVMETLKYTCVPSFTFMHCMCASLRGEEVCSHGEKCLRPFFVDGRHGNIIILKSTRVPSFTYMHCMVSKFEK